MTYTAAETSVDGAQPFHLYLFEEGSSAWRFVAGPSDAVTPGDIADQSGQAETWAASAIAHGRIVSTPDAGRGSLEIVFPLSDNFARRYLGLPRQSETALRIWRGHASAQTDLVALWSGRIVSARVEGEAIILTGQDLLTLVLGSTPRRITQRLCDHDLYGLGCGVDIASHEIAATVTARSGRIYTAAAAAGQADGVYSGGRLAIAGVFAHIEQHAGDQLTLSARLPELDTALGLGDVAVTIAPGCDRRRETCIARFSNLPNFGGRPDAPINANNPLRGARVR
ncbi:MAG: phage BR0599 family protein [Pseudomonadota bacterium]